MHPGSFKEKDKRYAGHNIWSYAIQCRLWSVAEYVWPNNWNEAGPRALEIFDMLLKIQGDVFEDAFLKIPNQGQKTKAKNYLEKWWSLEKNIEDLKQSDLSHREKLCRIWARPWAWPLLLSLPSSAHQVIFESWAIPNQNNQTAWHQASLYSKEPLFPLLLEKAALVGLNLKEVWSIKNAFDTRVIDTATLSLGYELPDEGEFLEANHRLNHLPDWQPKNATIG